MFCDYCRQLFELRQKAERYEPQHKGLAGTSSTSAPWSQPQLQQDSDEEREWSKETYKAKLESIRRGEKPASRPKIEIYEDVEDLFTPRLLWWKIPIRKDGLKAGYSHTPNADCQVCQMIFSNISPSLIDVLLKKNDKEEDGMAFVYQLKSTVNSKRMVAGNEAILSISLEFGKELLPMVRLQVMRRLRKCAELLFRHRTCQLSRDLIPQDQC